MMIPSIFNHLKNNVAQLKKIEAQIKKDREKLEKLDSIIQTGEDITQNRDQKDINQIIDQLNWVEKREAFMKDQEQKTFVY